jgi:DNA-binding NtrC family response regulator
MQAKENLLILRAPADKHEPLDRGIDFAAFHVTEVHDVKAACAEAQQGSIACALVSGEIPDLDPAEVLDLLHYAQSTLPVIFVSPSMTAGLAVRLVRAGAYYCVNSGENSDALFDAVNNAVEMTARRRAQASKKAAGNQWRDNLVGASRPMEMVAETISLIAKRRCTVLITGETGTGKEMAARALHAASQRGQHPMVSVNCSALPANLLEAELFGHTRGAFTGATSLRIGRFEQANKGTIFLDEIGDMPFELQAKLLRVLQEREIQRLGSSETIKIDVRVIAATNVDLQELVRQGKFRQDLFYRLNVVPLLMPPLRNRISDIAPLVRHFVHKVCAAEGIPEKEVSQETLARLSRQQWPGNVRQLENVVEMAVAVSGDRPYLTDRDFGLTSGVVVAFSARTVSGTENDCDGDIDLETAVSRFELSILDRALRQTGGNKTAAAGRLGIKRTTLIMKMRAFENSGLLAQMAG